MMHFCRRTLNKALTAWLVALLMIASQVAVAGYECAQDSFKVTSTQTAVPSHCQTATKSPIECKLHCEKNAQALSAFSWTGTPALTWVSWVNAELLIQRTTVVVFAVVDAPPAYKSQPLRIQYQTFLI
jgi:hypothetical protein